MSFGFIAINGSNETVINDSQPLYVQKRAGTLSSFGTTNIGVNKFNTSGGAVVSNREILVLSCSVNNFITFNLPFGQGGGVDPNYLGEFCSNQSSLPYKVFGPRTELAAPTGFNMAVFNSSGQCVWDAASTAIRINNAGRIAGSTHNSVGFQSSTITGANSVYATAGSAILRFSTTSGAPPGANGFYQMGARRTGTTSWRFEQTRITNEDGGGFIVGDFKFTSDFSFLLAVT